MSYYNETLGSLILDSVQKIGLKLKPGCKGDTQVQFSFNICFLN